MPEHTTEAAAIEDIARRANARTLNEPVDGAGRLHAEILREDERLVVEDLERYLDQPVRARGTAVLHDPKDFAAYVVRLHDSAHTTVWADVQAGTVIAVLDDHSEGFGAGWRSHTVVLKLRTDADWTHWTKLDGQLLGQLAFAQHIEDGIHCITDPSGAEMLEVATSLQATRKAGFSSAKNIQNGDVQMTWHEETDAKAGKSGQLEVPRAFTVQITPWLGCPSIDVEARLRYTIDGGQLRIGYALRRPDLVKQEVFESVVRSIADDLPDGVPVLQGTAPSALS